MTRFISLRSQDVGGAVQKAAVVDCDGAEPLRYSPVADAAVAADAAGRDVVLAIHGFNVSRSRGVVSLAALEAELALAPNFRFFGVLWPGDFWLPVVNYPWEASSAVTAGRNLARWLNQTLAGAASISFVSHSLGVRVLLEAVRDLDRPARELCLTAGAVDRDCLEGQYLGAKQNARRISVLSSVKDKALKLAYPAGDLISDLFLGDRDSPWRAALGLKGPKAPVAAPVFKDAIPPGAGFDHGDYFPPGKAMAPPPPVAKWPQAAAYMRRAVEGRPVYWGED